MAALPPEDRLRIALLGGVPPALGGGGLELQMTRTAAALRRRGHSVEHAEQLDAGATFDVLHAFGAEPNIWLIVQHWRRAVAPFVLSPVLVTSPGIAERTLVASAAVPGAVTTARMKRELLQRADAVVCLTDHERRLARRLGRLQDGLSVIGNGVDPIPEDALPQPPPELPDGPFALLLGGVSPRKRQREVVAALAGRLPAVVVGGWSGPPGGQAAFERELERLGGTWLGEIDDFATIQAIQRRALCQVLLSAAETQSLAVLEALAVGLPVIVSDIPSHRELALRHPQLVHMVASPTAAAGAVLSLRGAARPAAAALPSWDDVAAELEGVYRGVVAEPGSPA